MCLKKHVTISRFIVKDALCCPVSFAGINITYSYCTEWWLTPGIERLVSQHYKVPTASYRDAVWPVMDKPRPNVPCMWLGNAHPSALTHEMMANVVGYGLVRAVMESSSNTSCSQRSTATRLFQEMPVKQYCTAANASIDHHHNTTTAPRGTYMSSLNASSFQPLETGGWLWREDVPGKPGQHQPLPGLGAAGQLWDSLSM